MSRGSFIVPLRRHHFIADEMETNDLRRCSTVEMALNSIPDGRPEIVNRIGLGDDRSPKRACRVTALVLPL